MSEEFGKKDFEIATRITEPEQFIAAMFIDGFGGEPGDGLKHHLECGLRAGRSCRLEERTMVAGGD